MKVFVFLLTAGAMILAGCGGSDEVAQAGAKVTLTVDSESGDSASGDSEAGDSENQSGDPGASEETGSEEMQPEGGADDPTPSIEEPTVPETPADAAGDAGADEGAPSATDASGGEEGQAPIYPDASSLGIDPVAAAATPETTAAPTMTASTDDQTAAADGEVSADGVTAAVESGAAAGEVAETDAVLTETVATSGKGTTQETATADLDGTEATVTIETSIGEGSSAGVSVGAEISVTGPQGAQPEAEAGQSGADSTSTETEGTATEGAAEQSSASQSDASTTDTVWNESLLAVWTCEQGGEPTIAYYLYEPPQPAEGEEVCTLDISLAPDGWSAVNEKNFCRRTLAEILETKAQLNYECSCFSRSVPPASVGLLILKLSDSEEAKEWQCPAVSEEQKAEIPVPPAS